MAEASFTTADLSEDAPLEERLEFMTPLHTEILSRLEARRMLSERNISRRYDTWDETDEHCRMFINLGRQAKRADGSTIPNKKEMPFERAIVVPMSQALLQVRLVELMGIFFARVPAIEIEGAGPEDIRPGKMMEAVLHYDTEQMGYVTRLWSFLQDTEKYGIGVLYDTWEETPGYVYRNHNPDGNELVAALLRAQGIPEVTREWGIKREHNLWENIDPRSFWPDPRAPLSAPQRGEFIGHRMWRSHLWIKSRSIENGGNYFNVDSIGQAGPGVRRNPARSPRDATTLESLSMQVNEQADSDDKGFHSLDTMQVRIIPRDWKLSPSTRPEIWWFTWVDSQVLVRAHPLPYEHDEFTYSVGESNPDPHMASNPGSVELLNGLQRFSNWLFNSHYENTRRHLNNSMIYGTRFIEETDVLNRDAAGNFRLTAHGERLIETGRISVDNFFKQVQLTDVTRGHLGDAATAMDYGMRMLGTADQQMAQTARANRTLGEIERVLSASSKRMAVQARLNDTQALAPLIRRAIANRQQFTEVAQYFRIVGELMSDLGPDVRQVLVRPNDLAGNFDYVPNTGALPPDPARLADTWTRILEGVAKFPILMQPTPEGRQLNVWEIFNEAARNGGARNIERFYLPAPQVLPDEQVQNQAQQGNVVPLEAA